MPIDETKLASNLIVTPDQITTTEIQNQFGAKHEIIRDIPPGMHLTILAVATSAFVCLHIALPTCATSHKRSSH